MQVLCYIKLSPSPLPRPLTETRIGMSLMTSTRLSSVNLCAQSTVLASPICTTRCPSMSTSPGTTHPLWCTSRLRTLTYQHSTSTPSSTLYLTGMRQRYLYYKVSLCCTPLYSIKYLCAVPPCTLLHVCVGWIQPLQCWHVKRHAPFRWASQSRKRTMSLCSPRLYSRSYRTRPFIQTIRPMVLVSFGHHAPSTCAQEGQSTLVSVAMSFNSHNFSTVDPI